MSIYVEVQISAGLDKVWALTQDPNLHQRWDLRFSGISYLPKGEGEPERFTYSKKIGPWSVEGSGESVASRITGNEAVSSLKFWSDDPKSLIETGSGYWKYAEVEGSTRFLTGYDYKVRYGVLGRAADLLFRPLLGWATAWSFDSMRLWAEKDIAPELSRTRAFSHAVARIGLALCWMYEGLIPKLSFPLAGDLAIMQKANPPFLDALTWVRVFGIGEAVFGLLILILFRRRWILSVQTYGLVVLTVLALMSSPEIFVQPFNPASLNIAMIALALIGTVAGRELPSAKNCKRRPIKGDA